MKTNRPRLTNTQTMDTIKILLARFDKTVEIDIGTILEEQFIQSIPRSLTLK